MPNNTLDAMSWLAGAFYVLIALAVVYLFFFKIVPLVIAGVKWTVFDIFRITIVLGILAVLLGCVAIITADWIFSQVLDTLPKTRMAREIDRVSGSVLDLSLSDSMVERSTGSYNPLFGSNSPRVEPEMPASPESIPQEEPATPTVRLKENALQLWVAQLQSQFNTTGKLSDNEQVMAKRDIPEGVVCDVAAISGGYYPKAYEEWQLVCSMDSFQSSVSLRVNGTAARGLTGGGYYAAENPFTVYGTGEWPQTTYERIPTPTAQSIPTVSASAQQGGPVVATPQPEATARIHQVQPGENLAIIAQRYKVTVNALVSLNQGKFPQLQYNPNVIVVGWRLSIPD